MRAFPTTTGHVEWLDRLVGGRHTCWKRRVDFNASRIDAWISVPDLRLAHGEVFLGEASIGG